MVYVSLTRNKWALPLPLACTWLGICRKQVAKAEKDAAASATTGRINSPVHPTSNHFVYMGTSSGHTRAMSSPPTQNEGGGRSLARQMDTVSVRRMQTSSGWQHGTTRSTSPPRQGMLDRAHISVEAHAMSSMLHDSPLSCAWVTAVVISCAVATSTASITSRSTASATASKLPPPTADRTVSVSTCTSLHLCILLLITLRWLYYGRMHCAHVCATQCPNGTCMHCTNGTFMPEHADTCVSLTKCCRTCVCCRDSYCHPT